MADFSVDELPLIAILRGVEPDEVMDISGALIETGFSLIEVPLNSNNAFNSIERLVNAFGSQAIIGAGTVMSMEDMQTLIDIGVGMAVMPHCDPRLIALAKGENLVCLPGVATMTEAIDALEAGADGLKLFPAEVLGPNTVSAWRAVLPLDTIMLPVGGINPDNMDVYLDAGADGFGLGSALYKPGMSVDEVAENANQFIATWDDLTAAGDEDDDEENADHDAS